MRNIGTATRTIGVAVAAVLMLAACELPDFNTLDDLTSALDEGAAIHGAAGRLRRTADTLRAAVREHCGLPKERTEQ